MHGAMAIIDAVTPAQSIKRVWPHRVLATRQRQRIDNPIIVDWWMSQPVQLGVDESHIEGRVVRDQLCAVDEIEKILKNSGK